MAPRNDERRSHAKRAFPSERRCYPQPLTWVGIPAPDLVTVQDFLRFYIATSYPQLDKKVPTADAIYTVGEWFFAASLGSLARRPWPRTGVRCIMYDEDLRYPPHSGFSG